MKKLVASAMAAFVGVSAIAVGVTAVNNAKTVEPAAPAAPAVAQAAEPAFEMTKLKADQLYHYDLDQDGTDEEIYYTLTEKGSFDITVNGVTTSVKLDEEYYNPELTILDIDSKDQKLDLYADCYAWSDDVEYSGLFRYEEGKLGCIWNPEYAGTILSTDNNGIFALRVDRLLPADTLIGNHWDKIYYSVSEDVVEAVPTDTYEIAETLDDYNYKEGVVAPLTCAADTTFKVATDGTETFTLAAGTKVTPTLIKQVSEETCYVAFTTEDGQTGWLFSDDYDWENPPFTDMCECD